MSNDIHSISPKDIIEHRRHSSFVFLKMKLTLEYLTCLDLRQVCLALPDERTQHVNLSNMTREMLDAFYAYESSQAHYVADCDMANVIYSLGFVPVIDVDFHLSTNEHDCSSCSMTFFSSYNMK
jgi:hypothetical protein